MEVTQTLTVTDRSQWRQWLQDNHATANHIWLIFYGRSGSPQSIPYRDAVEESLCFGWIDGIVKKLDDERTAQRFSPRRPRSNWTELNKDRARRLIAAGLMTEAGFAVLPDLSPRELHIAPDILAALQADPQTWAHFEAFPDLYKRIRIDHIEDVRDQPELFQKRLAKFVDKTRHNKTFGVMT